MNVVTPVPPRPAGKYDNVIPNKIKAEVQPKANIVKPEPSTTSSTNVINQAWQPIPDAPVAETVVSNHAPAKKPQPAPVAAQEPKQAVQATALEEAIVAPKKPKVIRKNTITDPIDLGEYALIATNPENLANLPVEAVVNVKRYNDVERLPVAPPAHIEYELVETKI